MMMSFCREFERLYGSQADTTNMHLHMHLVECILDFGLIYVFWLFPFERENGYLEKFNTNQRSIEVQIMRRYTKNQIILDLPLPELFREHFESVFPFLDVKQSSPYHYSDAHLARYNSSDNPNLQLLWDIKANAVGPLIPDNLSGAHLNYFQTSVMSTMTEYLRQSVEDF